MKLETLIGLEFHVQLKTKSKIFCSCSNDPNTDEPNNNVCPICLGHPGTLPVINKSAVQMAIKAALALNCQINLFTKFDRKNYFYPDLPKGYQISQFDKPLAEKGWLIINNKAAERLTGRMDKEDELAKIGIIRLHMEEDSAKSIHEKTATLIDYNRSGAPLIEIVTYPHLSTPEEAKTFGQEIQLIMRHLNISHADMEKGELRCDANISLRPKGDHNFYPKTEIKNINSFKALERALAFEIERQTLLWTAGQAPQTQETRGWNDAKQETVLQRSKEESHDYRYFPEPDLPPLTFTPEEIEAIKSKLPELPQDKRVRFMKMYGFSGEETKILTENKHLANYTEQVISELKNWLNSIDNVEGTPEENWRNNKNKLVKSTASWIINKFLPILIEKKLAIKKLKITAENFAEFITLVYQNKINSTIAQAVLLEMFETGADPSHILEEKKFTQIDSEEDLAVIIKNVINNNPAQVEEYRGGKEPVIKYFIGLVMRETKGKANPEKVEELLRRLLITD